MNPSNSRTTLATVMAVSLIGLAGCASDTPPVAATPQQASTAATPSSGAQPSSTATAATPATSGVATKPAASSVYFDYDSFTVKSQHANDVRANAEYMMKTNAAMELGGNADERGSREYNMALGQKRADAVKRALTALGAKAERIETISFGEDKPRKTGHDEAAWAENRRVDFVQKSK